VKVVDFGLARLLDASATALTRPSRRRGVFPVLRIGA